MDKFVTGITKTFFIPLAIGVRTTAQVLVLALITVGLYHEIPTNTTLIPIILGFSLIMGYILKGTNNMVSDIQEFIED